MLNSLVMLVLFMLGTIICASIIPLITVIWFKVKKNTETKTIYLFSCELFEAEYPDARYWHCLNEQYEKKKSEEFCKQLPWERSNILFLQLMNGNFFVLNVGVYVEKCAIFSQISTANAPIEAKRGLVNLSFFLLLGNVLKKI